MDTSQDLKLKISMMKFAEVNQIVQSLSQCMYTACDMRPRACCKKLCEYYDDMQINRELAPPRGNWTVAGGCRVRLWSSPSCALHLFTCLCLGRNKHTCSI